MVDVLAYLYTAATIGVFAWLDDPQLLSKFRHGVQYSIFIWILCFVVKLLELDELRVVEAFLDVEGERQVSMVFFSNGLVVDLHVVIDCFLVAQVVIIFHLAVFVAIVSGHVLLFLFFLLFTFLARSADDAAIFGGTAVRRC